MGRIGHQAVSSLLAFAMVCSTVPVQAQTAGLTSLSGTPVAASSAPSINGGSETQVFALRWYIADLKPSFPENNQFSADTAITFANYRAVLDGLKNNAHVNGIRLPIVSTVENPAHYSSLYRHVVDYARHLGLVIYASPMSTGMDDYAGWSDARYADWLARYANQFQPDFLSPFNEADLDSTDMAAIVAALRHRLNYFPRLIGPDQQHVGSTARSLQDDPALPDLFNIVGSHDADLDCDADATAWSGLVTLAGSRPVWSSENPAAWDDREKKGKIQPGLNAALNGGVQGLVIWMAKPGLVDDAGNASPLAQEIASHLSF